MVSNEELVQRYNQGEYTALDELTQNNMRLIQFVANKFTASCSFIDNDDLIQQGWLGFLRAVQTYKADKPNAAKFSTWAVYWIRQSVSRYLKQKVPKDETSLHEPIGEGEEILKIDIIEDKDDNSFLEMWRRLEILDLRRDLEKVMQEKLTLQQSEVIKLRYGWDNLKEWTFSELGELYGMTQQGAREIHQRALGKLRNSKWARKMIMERLTEKRITFKYYNPILSLIVNSN